MTVKILCEKHINHKARLPFLAVLNDLVVRGVIFIDHAGEAEAFLPDSLDLSELVQMHLSQVEHHVVLLYFPVKTESVRDLQEGFEIIWQSKRGIFFFPLRNSDLGHAYNQSINFRLSKLVLTLSLDKFDVCDTDMAF